MDFSFLLFLWYTASGFCFVNQRESLFISASTLRDIQGRDWFPQLHVPECNAATRKVVFLESISLTFFSHLLPSALEVLWKCRSRWYTLKGSGYIKTYIIVTFNFKGTDHHKLKISEFVKADLFSLTLLLSWDRPRQILNQHWHVFKSLNSANERTARDFKVLRKVKLLKHCSACTKISAHHVSLLQQMLFILQRKSLLSLKGNYEALLSLF